MALKAKKILIENFYDSEFGGTYWSLNSDYTPLDTKKQIYAIAFTLHIYFDFSGYSDMAIGLGKIMGFDFIENFNYPYISKSITEFWRRWHISLGSWFRDYVYIPLGGNRVSKLRQFINILVVWLLTGFWHGAEWNFPVWGLYFAVILLIEKTWLLEKLKKSKIISHFYVLFLVVISFVIFNAGNMTEAFADIKGMFGFAGINIVSTEAIYYLRSYAVVFILAVIGATPLPTKIVAKIRNSSSAKILNIIEPIFLIALMVRWKQIGVFKKRNIEEKSMSAQFLMIILNMNYFKD